MKPRPRSRESIPGKLYRYFANEEHAQRLVDGHVWLSTLEHVRKCDATRADPGDATMEYRVSRLDSSIPAAEAKVIHGRLQEARVFNGELGSIVVKDISVVEVAQDCLLLCLSGRKLDRKLMRLFGEFCVEIENPIALWRETTNALGELLPGSSTRFGPVTYSGRSYRDVEARPGLLGFASVASLAYEDEYRMLWAPPDHGAKLHPQELTVPRARLLCRRLN